MLYYLSRRLTPALLAVVFWYGFIMEHVGSGPQWNSIINKNAELCKKNAWTNLLYIQNFFPFEEMVGLSFSWYNAKYTKIRVNSLLPEECLLKIFTSDVNFRYSAQLIRINWL